MGSRISISAMSAREREEVEWVDLESWDERDEGAERGPCGGIRRVPLGTRRGLGLARATMFSGTVGGLGSALPVDIVACPPNSQHRPAARRRDFEIRS